MGEIDSNQHHSDKPRSTWVLTTKRVGDTVAGWVIQSLDESDIRYLETSERCQVTSFCYPTGAKVIRAKLLKPTH